MEQPALPETGKDLVRIHKVITRSINIILNNSLGLGPDDILQDGFRLYVKSFVSVIDAHHLGEDEIAFPFWKAKIPGGSFDILSQQHRQMHPLILKMNVWHSSGIASWDPEYVAELHETTRILKSLWVPHVQLEEREIGPRSSDHLLTRQESAALSGKLVAHAQQHTLPVEITIPFVIYNLFPADRAEFTRSLPPLFDQQLALSSWEPDWTPMIPFLLD